MALGGSLEGNEVAGLLVELPAGVPMSKKKKKKIHLLQRRAAQDSEPFFLFYGSSWNKLNYSVPDQSHQGGKKRGQRVPGQVLKKLEQ